MDKRKAQPPAEQFNGEASVRTSAKYAEMMRGPAAVDEPETVADISHNNGRRAGFALDALDRYAQVTGDWVEDAEVALGDLLGDLRHLADALGVSWEAVDLHGESHYIAEVDGRA